MSFLSSNQQSTESIKNSLKPCNAMTITELQQKADKLSHVYLAKICRRPFKLNKSVSFFNQDETNEAQVQD